MNRYLLSLLLIVLTSFSNLFLNADESQSLNEILLKVSKLKEKNEYDEIIKLINIEIKGGKIHQLYFDILGGAYAGTKNVEESYLSYLRGHLYNPTTEYSRDKLVKKMNYIENRQEELAKNSWITKYLNIKKLFDAGDLINAEKKLSDLSNEGKNLDVLCILNKDILSFKSAPKETKAIMTSLNEAESMFNKVIAQQPTNCPEYVYYEFADLLFKANKYDLALNNYQIAMSKNIDRRDSTIKTGLCFLYTKKYMEAKQIFFKCTEKYSEYSEAFLYLGFTHWALKESDKAIKTFTKVVEMENSSNSMIKEKAKKAIVVVNKGDLFLTPNDMDKLIKSTQTDESQKKKPETNEKDVNDQPADKK